MIAFDRRRVWRVRVRASLGVLGWLMMKFDVPRAPFVLALVLAWLLETSLRQALLLSFGSPIIFVERPISDFLLTAVLATFLAPFACAAGAPQPETSRQPRVP